MNTISKPWIWTSCLIAILVTSASLLGIFNPDTYAQETANWALQAVGQDIGNLLAVPVLLISTYYLKKKSMRALVCWMGALLYFIYAYLIYAFFVHFNYLFLVYVAVLGLSVYTLIGGLWEQSLARITAALPKGRTAAPAALLIVIGLLFGLLWLSEIMPSLLSARLPASASAAGMWVNPVHVIDLSFVLPGMVLTGMLIRRKNPIGYLFLAPWLMFSVLMGSSIVVTLILELSKGNPTASVPLFMIGSIVIASAVVLIRYLQQKV